MANRSLVGRCGLYCGACVIYRAYKDGGEFLRGRAQHFKCKLEAVRCEGCQALTPNCWGYNCRIVKCLASKELNFCYECSEMDSCKKFGKLANDYLEDGVDIRANLDRIEGGDVDAWLRENDTRYRCPACHGPIPVGDLKKCYHCGATLRI